MSDYRSTPRPWRHHDMETNSIVSKNGLSIARTDAVSRKAEENWANAELILLAVNAHDDLLAACKRMLPYIADGDLYEHITGGGGRAAEAHDRFVGEVRAAIARAEETA